MSDNSDTILDLIHRAEHGVPHKRDSEVLFAALKSAAHSHASNTEYLTFLKFHIKNGLEHVNSHPVEH
jgi:hypothetical protein